jgi:hypothetical protein
LLELAHDATQHGWWEDYTEALAPQLQEFIGLEAEAASSLQWQADAIPGLMQTEDYARQLAIAYQTVVPTTLPSVSERFLQARMIRQERLTHEPVLQLSLVLDEALLLRRIGDSGVMRVQLQRLVDASELPNVELRILPLNRDIALLAGSFVIMTFGSRSTTGTASLGDIVSTENLSTEFYIEGEVDTHLYRLFFQALANASLPPPASRDLIAGTISRTWS